MQEKRLKWIRKTGNISMVAALVIAATGLLRIWYISRDLPAGACPLVDNRPWFFTALGLCLVSLLCMLVEWKAKKQA